MIQKMIIFTLLVFAAASCKQKSENTDSNVKVNPIETEEVDSTAAFDPVAPQPSFPGGIDGLKKYLKENYHWTQGQTTVEGTVYIEFSVLEDGTISNPKIIRGLCETCDAEAMRLVKAMPKWEPAKVNDVPTAETTVLPINFGLTNPYDK